jgi:hypothetical protein
MTHLGLHDFITTHRVELIARCQAKAAMRRASTTAPSGPDHGVPVFLDQLVIELRHGPSQTHAIATGASAHGADILRQGGSASHVVHGYGDVCQSITDLAVETDVSIDTGSFRTLNRCLDDAIAGAVTSHAREGAATTLQASEAFKAFLDTAISAFAMLRQGDVPLTGNTGSLLGRCLQSMSTQLASHPIETR